MLNWAVAFLLLALIAVVLGTGSAPVSSFWMAQVLFAACAALFTLSVIRGVLRR